MESLVDVGSATAVEPAAVSRDDVRVVEHEASAPESAERPEVDVDPKWFALLVSIAALALSAYQAHDVATTRRNAAGAEGIRTSYQIFRDLTRAQFEHPLLAHLFETVPESYRKTVRGVRASIVSATAQDVARLRLEERGMADHIFTAYEEIFFNWKQSVETDNNSSFLEADLTGYLPALLCNPRLRWFWDDDSGRLGYNYSQELHDHYDKNVKGKCDSTRIDAKGPFAAELEQ